MESTVGIRSTLPDAAPLQPTGKGDETRLDALPPPSVQSTDQARTGSVAATGADKYFCGALTKRGTPCSRKVKAKGLRCFQHEGRPEAPQSE
ncbi:MAG: hypothetical protein ABL984_12975 [Pyrinomonadaceae bacterium]